MKLSCIRSILTLSAKVLLVLSFAYGLVQAHAKQHQSEAPIDTALMPYEDADAYAIYAILLKSENHASFQIQAETESQPSATSDSAGIKGDRTFYKVWGSALKNYASGLRNPVLLVRRIPIEVPYELIPTAKIVARNKSGSNYPNDLSGAYYWFSAVGFDAQKTHAIVNMNYICGGLCGGGGPYFFEKVNGKWRRFPSMLKPCIGLHDLAIIQAELPSRLRRS
jgi:hypothetical protein